MPKKIDVTRMSLKELAEAGVPYLVTPDDLRALGIDPDVYSKSGSNNRNGWAGWMLDRKKDAVLIERLQSMQSPHRTMQ
jgi:hypothetical protein